MAIIQPYELAKRRRVGREDSQPVVLDRTGVSNVQPLQRKLERLAHLSSANLSREPVGLVLEPPRDGIDGERKDRIERGHDQLRQQKTDDDRWVGRRGRRELEGPQEGGVVQEEVEEGEGEEEVTLREEEELERV